MLQIPNLMRELVTLLNLNNDEELLITAEYSTGNSISTKDGIKWKKDEMPTLRVDHAIYGNFTNGKLEVICGMNLKTTNVTDDQENKWCGQFNKIPIYKFVTVGVTYHPDQSYRNLTGTLYNYVTNNVESFK